MDLPYDALPTSRLENVVLHQDIMSLKSNHERKRKGNGRKTL